MKWKRQEKGKNKRRLVVFLTVILFGFTAMYQSRAIEQTEDAAILQETEQETMENGEEIPESEGTQTEAATEQETETESTKESEIETETESEWTETEIPGQEVIETEQPTEVQSESEKQDVYETETEHETESESDWNYETENESEQKDETEEEPESERESETETETERQDEIPFDVILLTGNGVTRAAGQASVDTFGQLEFLGARTAYKHHKETFQTIYCLNYVRNGAYGIYGSDRTSPVHPSITYVLAKGMKLAKNNETMDAAYRGRDDQESYYITQMALHLVNGAIGGEEDISGYLDQSKDPSIYQKIYGLYQDAMAQKEPIVDEQGYTKEVTCSITPSVQKTWIRDEKKGGFRTKEAYKTEISDPGRVLGSTVTISDNPSEGLSIVEQGDGAFYLHATETAFENLKKQENLKIQIVWSGQVQEKTGYRYVHLSGEWPGITEYQDLIFLEDAEQPVNLRETASAVIEIVPAEKGKITVIKNDKETKKGLAGAIFGIYEEKTCKTLVAKTAESDETGKAVTPEFEVKEKGSYFLKELKAPLYHVLDQTVTEIPAEDLKNGKTAVYTRENEAQKGKITLKKKDERPEEKGEGTLEGAVYLIFAKERIYQTDLVTTAYEAYREGDNEKSKSFVTSLTTDKNGEAETEALYPGTYLVLEKTPSKGYQKEEVVHEVQVLPEDSAQVLIKKEVISVEKKIRGDLEITKTGERGDTYIPLGGAEFTVTSKRDGKTAAILITDENGYATTKKEGQEGSLPYGTYIVTETKAPSGYETAEPFEVFIERQGQLGQYEVQDIRKRGKIRIQKVDAETKKRIPFAGVKFQILEKESGKVILKDLETDQTGTVVLEETLPFGTYLLEEIVMPDGYQKGETVEFLVDREELISIVYENQPVKGKIRIKKHSAESGEGLSDVVFVITAKEDIVTGDGSVRLKDGETAEIVTTDKDGIALSKELYPGLYEVREERQKPGYCKETEAREIRIPQKGEMIQEICLENPMTTFKIKKTEKDSDSGLEGVIFWIWREGEEKKEYTTDQKGEITVKGLVPGTYFAEEKEAKEGYLRSEERFSFTVDEDGRMEGKSELEYQAENVKMKAKIKVAKLANKTTGAVLKDGRYQGEKVSGIYTANEVVEYQILVTNSGNVTVKNIRLQDAVQEELKNQIVPESAEFSIENGTYQSGFGREVKVTRQSKTEVMLDELISGDSFEVKFRASLKENATKSENLQNIIYVTGEYEPTPGKRVIIPEDEDDWDEDKIKIQNRIQVTVEKVDAVTEKLLAGAKLTVLDENGGMIDEWTSKEEAHHVQGVEVRKVYTLKEIEAPKGYQKANSFTFTVLDTSEVQKIVMKDEPEPEKMTESSGTPVQKQVVKTGDETETAVYMAGVFTALCIVTGILLRKARKER